MADARAASPDHPVDARRPAPVTVVGDEGRLRQVLANLLANVRVHTPPGTHVTVRVAAEEGWATVEVLDETDPLKEEKAEKLMMEVHQDGRSVVSSGSREEMERDVRAMHEYGLWATLSKSE